MSEVICKVSFSTIFSIPFFMLTINYFYSSLRVAEMVWSEGVLIKDYPPEAFTIKCLDDSWALLKTEDGQSRYKKS